MANSDNLPGYDELSRAFNPGKPATGPMEAFSKGVTGSIDLANSLTARRQQQETYDRTVQAFKAKYIGRQAAEQYLKNVRLPDGKPFNEDDVTNMLGGLTFPMNIDDLKDLVIKYSQNRSTASSKWVEAGEHNFDPGDYSDGKGGNIHLDKAGVYSVQVWNEPGSVDDGRIRYINTGRIEPKEPTPKTLIALPSTYQKEIDNVRMVGSEFENVLQNYQPSFVGFGDNWVNKGLALFKDDPKYAQFSQGLNHILNTTMHEFGGATLTANEMGRIVQQLPNPSMTETNFLSRLKQSIVLYNKGVEKMNSQLGFTKVTKDGYGPMAYNTETTIPKRLGDRYVVVPEDAGVLIDPSRADALKGGVAAPTTKTMINKKTGKQYLVDIKTNKVLSEVK